MAKKIYQFTTGLVLSFLWIIGDSVSGVLERKFHIHMKYIVILDILFFIGLILFFFFRFLYFDILKVGSLNEALLQSGTIGFLLFFTLFVPVFLLCLISVLRWIPPMPRGIVLSFFCSDEKLISRMKELTDVELVDVYHNACEQQRQRVLLEARNELISRDLLSDNHAAGPLYEMKNKSSMASFAKASQHFLYLEDIIQKNSKIIRRKDLKEAKIKRQWVPGIAGKRDVCEIKYWNGSFFETFRIIDGNVRRWKDYIDEQDTIEMEMNT